MARPLVFDGKSTAVRLSAEVRGEVERAAAERSLSLSDWLRLAALDALEVQRAEEAERRDREAMLGAAYPQRAA